MGFNLDTYAYTGAQGVFFILLFFFTIHAIFLSYHWFTYGTNKSLSLVALALYLTGGAILFIVFSLMLALS